MAAAVALATCFAASDSRAAVSGPPNIVIIVADDMGWKDVGFHGAEFPTPHIDRIASEGVELGRFYAMPVCSPTRVALMTGHHPIRYGLQRVTIKPWTNLGIPPEVETLAEMLARAGYSRRGVFGKWHLGESARYHPYQQGFTDFVGHYGGAIDYFRHLRLGGLDWHHGYSLSAEEGYSTELIGRHATRFIRDVPINERFLLYVPFNAIHGPNHVTPEDLSRNSSIHPENRRLKAAMMTSMDDEIGRILAALDERGLTESTLVLFFSDNGGVPSSGSSNEPLRGRKHSLYEGGIRVAAAARWPDGGISGDGQIDASLSVLDLYPTLLRIVGLGERHGFPSDGENVLGILTGSRQERSDFEFFGYFNGKNLPGNNQLTDSDRLEQDAVFSDGWKLVRLGPNLDRASDPKQDSTIELFRIRDDPSETRNAASEHPDVVDRLLDKVVRFRKLKPKDALSIPLDPPDEWAPPVDWSIARPGTYGDSSGSSEGE